MKYLEGFRNQAAATAITEKIHELAAKLPAGNNVRIMEVCGTHTVAIARAGIRSLLPGNIELISGPGCPVCVTDPGYIDAAVKLTEKGVCLASFGDMLKVPGTNKSLIDARSEGAVVKVCYSPLEALEFARQNPDKEIVFLGIGFETTVGPVISLVDRAISEGINNISILTAFKTVPQALAVLSTDPLININAYICPAHVSAIIGAKPYEHIAREFKKPCVIAGFEPLDILYGVQGILQQLLKGESRVDNQYNRVVRTEGNKKAQALFEKYLQPCDTPWRGAGVIPGSGLELRPEYARYDALKRHNLEMKPGKISSACRCGDVLKGIIRPTECVLFGKTCTPERPIGPCMVSSEGTCSAYYKYSEIKDAEQAAAGV